VRIPWSSVNTAGKDIHLDIDGDESGAMDWETWIDKHVIARIPGAG
jgi:hypothetical protein